VEPVGEAVQDHVVLAPLLEVEGLDRHPLDVEAERVAVHRDRQVEAPDQLLVGRRPAEICAQGETDVAGDVSHGDFLELP